MGYLLGVENLGPNAYSFQNGGGVTTILISGLIAALPDTQVGADDVASHA